MNYNYTIKRERWQNPNEGVATYRGVSASYRIVDGRVDVFYITGGNPAADYPFRDTAHNLFRCDLDNILREWCRRVDMRMSELAVVLARAGEPVLTTTPTEVPRE